MSLQNKKRAKFLRTIIGVGIAANSVVSVLSLAETRRTLTDDERKKNRCAMRCIDFSTAPSGDLRDSIESVG